MKKMTIKDWEVQENIVSIREEEDFKLKSQLADALQSEEDNDRQERELEAIKDKFNRAYYQRSKNRRN